MNNSSVATEQLKALKRKLDASIQSRSALEESFNNQSALLLQFIGKLSQVCKGLDLKLDNKLANLRSLLTKATPLSEIEREIQSILELLKNFAHQNEQNIRNLEQQFIAAGKTLQKTSGLPNQLRRDLRELLKQAQESKDSLLQYVPLMQQLIVLYDDALTAKNNVAANEVTTQTAPINAGKLTNKVDVDIIDRFLTILNQLMLSDSQYSKVVSIKSKLNDNVSSDTLIECFLETFNLLNENLRQERSTAESFLSSLSATLETVQSAVKTSLLSNKEAQIAYDKINEQLHQQVSSMTKAVEQATSLTNIKEDINGKLKQIAATIKQKATLEQSNQQNLEQQLQQMQQEIKALERQGKQFEIRLHEQHIKSMQDALTKLGNRAAFDEHFAKEIVRFHQKPFDLALVVLDLDNFKTINDTYGHTAGDKTLQVIAKTMQKYVPKDVFIGRYGGEEFVMIFNNLKKTALVKQLNLLRQKVAELPFKFKNNRVTITVSIGATHVTSDDNVHIAFERADTGLYQAKEKGKNKVIYL